MKIPQISLLAVILFGSLPLRAAGPAPESEVKILKAATDFGLSSTGVVWMADPADEVLWKFPGFDYDGKSELLPAAGSEPFAKFRRVTLPKETDVSWSHKILFKVPKAFQSGDLLHLVYWVRAGKSETAGRTFPVDISSRPVQDKVRSEIIKTELVEDWQIVHIEIPVLDELTEGELNISFQVGGSSHVTDIGGVALLKE